MTMKESSAELATGWIEAWIRMDMEWLRERLAPEFVHTSPDPAGAHPELLVDSNAVLAPTVTKQRLQHIAGRHFSSLEAVEKLSGNSGWLCIIRSGSKAGEL